MDRLISKELIDKLVIREVEWLGRVYRPIFQYTGKMVVDTHEAEVGFVRDDGTLESVMIHLPSKRADGLLQRFRTLWYPINLVLPPVCHRVTPTCKAYLQTLVSDNRSATRLTDFLPAIYNSKPEQMTPLMQSLYNPDGDPVEDTSKWIVLDTQTAIIELFNQKIFRDIERSTRGGFKGISSSARALNTLLRAYVRFHGEEDDDSEFGAYLETEGDNVHDEYESLVLGKISVEDRKGVLVIHPMIKKVDVTGDTPIDFCTCSQSRPMVSARIKDGVSVEDCRFVGKPVFPYAQWRRGVVGITADDPRRVLVGRAISRSLCIEQPMKPYAESDVILNVGSLSLPGVRMSHPMNYEDGIVVSQTFADMMAAYKIYTDTFAIPAGTDCHVVKKEFDGLTDRKQAAKDARNTKAPEGQAPYVIRPGDLVATLVYKDAEEQTVVKEVRTRLKVPAIVLRIEHVETPTDMEEDGSLMRIVSYAYLPLMVGDKVSDGHGNKCTVSMIIPDSAMPKWNNVRCHYIATPYMMKRLALGAEIEDKLALVGYHMETQVLWDSTNPPTFEEVDEYVDEMKETEPACATMSYTGTVTMEDGMTYDDVPLSLRRMYRLDNIAAEALIVRTGAKLEDAKRISRNIRLSLEIGTFLARGARNIAHEVIEQSGSKEFVQTHLIPMLYAAIGRIPHGVLEEERLVVVKRKLPKILASGPTSVHALRGTDLTDTPADPRLKECYGVIRYKGKGIVIPPHDPLTNIGNGSVTVSRLAIAANRVISEIASEDVVNRCETIQNVRKPFVKQKIEDYERTLYAALAGKTGMVRNAVLPVFPCTIRAVVSPHGYPDPFTIMLPRRAFKQLLRQSEKAEQVYTDRKNWKCLVKRDPVHRPNNVLAVNFQLWDRDTIGVSPLLIGAVDGDFDGDAMVAMFPLTIGARMDLVKMQQKFEDIYQPSKQLKDVPADRAWQALECNVGWASTADSPHESDTLKNEELFEFLRRMPTYEEGFTRLCDEAVTAARDFELVKDGTALCGALGLRFIYSMTTERSDLLTGAMELYHILAQNTLNAKAGIPTPALEVVNAFTSGNSAKLGSSLAAMGFTHQACIQELERMCKLVKKEGSFMKYLTKYHPATACMQRSSMKNEVRAFAQAVLSDEKTGLGMWETLVDYLTGKDEEVPYAYSADWSFVDQHTTQIAKKLSEALG